MVASSNVGLFKVFSSRTFCGIRGALCIFNTFLTFSFTIVLFILLIWLIFDFFRFSLSLFLPGISNRQVGIDDCNVKLTQPKISTIELSFKK